jgi:hypothetical protein
MRPAYLPGEGQRPLALHHRVHSPLSNRTFIHVFWFTIIGGLFISEMTVQQNAEHANTLKRTDTVVLVTGGSGTLGRAIYRESQNRAKEHKEKCVHKKHLWAFFDCFVLRRWIFTDIKDGDLRQDFETRRLFIRHRPTHVLHLAALSTAVKDGDILNPVDAFRDNAMMNDNVMEISMQMVIKRSRVFRLRYSLTIQYYSLSSAFSSFRKQKSSRP